MVILVDKNTRSTLKRWHYHFQPFVPMESLQSLLEYSDSSTLELPSEGWHLGVSISTKYQLMLMGSEQEHVMSGHLSLATMVSLPAVSHCSLPSRKSYWWPFFELLCESFHGKSLDSVLRWEGSLALSEMALALYILTCCKILNKSHHT